VAHKAVVGKGLGASGFSAGAAGALLLSEREPDLVKAVVAFYGTAGQVDYSGARAAYLGHYAEVDEWEPIDEVRGTQEALRAAGCEVTFHTYLASGTGSLRKTASATTTPKRLVRLVCGYLPVASSLLDA
jgi:dienelactone hydrolase